ncbi:MAG: hypothetical protein BZ135_07100 [Methanosphaera sp. rholeuAM6]|nr:MAG: hypothetical protein BZ135_07100 [Methanosphaera sp. rholeuAM6]
MKNKNIKRMFLFLTLLVLLMGIASATEDVSNDTGSDAGTLAHSADVTDNFVTSVAETGSAETNTKEVQKQDDFEQKMIKADGAVNTYTTTASSYDNLAQKAESAESTNYGSNAIGLESGDCDTTGIKLRSTSDDAINLKVKGDSGTEIQTVLTVNPINNVSSGEYISLSGQLTDIDGNPLSYMDLQVYVEGNAYSVATEYWGDFETNIPVTVIGPNNLTVVFNGYEGYAPSNASATFNVTKKMARIYIDYYDSLVSVNQEMSIRGRLYGISHDEWDFEYDYELPNKNIQISFNGNSFTVETDDEAYFNKQYTPAVVGTYNVTVIFEDDEYMPVNVTKTVTVTDKPITGIGIDWISSVKYGHNVTITGYVYNGLGNQTVVIDIEGDKFNTKTDEDGYFGLVCMTTRTGYNQVTASLISDDYACSDFQESFYVDPLSSILESNVIYSEDALLVNYRLYDENDDAISNATINIGGDVEESSLVTDENGQCTYVYAKSDEYVTVYASFAGDSIHDSTGNEIYIEENRIYTDIGWNDGELDYSYELGKYVKPISLTLTDNNGNVLVNHNVSLIINGTIIRGTTDNRGMFNHNFTTDTLGTYTVEAVYSGDGVYYQSSQDGEIDLFKQNIDHIDLSLYQSGTNIEGEIYSIYLENWDEFTPDYLTVTVNGEQFNVNYTNWMYRFIYPVEEAGNYEVTVCCIGNELVNPYNTTQDINMESISSEIGLYYDIDTVEVGYTISISGYLNNHQLDGHTIFIRINDEEFNTTVIWDDFSLEYTPKTVGINNVTIFVKGGLYDVENYSTSFEVIKKSANITLYDIRNIVLGDSVNIEGYVDNDKLNGQTLFVRINDEVLNTTVEWGYYSLTYTPQTRGTYNVTVYVVGEEYDVENVSKTFNVTKNVAILFPDVVSLIGADYEMTIGGTLYEILYDEWGYDYYEPLSMKNVQITVNGESFNVKTDGNGDFGMYYTPTVVGTNNVTMIFTDDEYEPVNVTKTFNVTDMIVTSVDVDWIYNDVKLGTDVTIRGYVENGVNNQTVEIDVNGEKFYTTTSYGYYNMNYTTKTTGRNNVTVSLISDKYIALNQTMSFDVIRLDSMMEASVKANSENDSLLVTYRLFDENGEAIPNATINIGGGVPQSSLVTDENGQCTYVYAKSDEYLSIYASFDGDANHYGWTKDIRIEENMIESYIGLSYGDLEYDNATGKYFKPITVSLTAHDDGLANQNVSLKINGTLIRGTTDNNGEFKYNFTTDVLETYAVEASYPGDGVYLPISRESEMEIQKLNAVFNYGINLYQSGSNIECYIRLIELDNGADFAENITITVDGEEHTVSPDGWMYRFTYPVTEAGSYDVTISYGGNDLINPFSITENIEINTISANITLRNVTSAELGKLVCITGYPSNDELEGQTIFIRINDEEFNTTVWWDGFSLLYTPETLGINNVTVYMKSGVFDVENVSNTFNVTKPIPKVSINCDSLVKVDNRMYIWGTLYTLIPHYNDWYDYWNEREYLVNKTVQIKINDETFNVETDEYGYYDLEYTPAVVGTNNITVIFDDEEYELLIENETFTVTEKNITWIGLDVRSDDFKYGANVTIGGYVDNELSGQKIVIDINGEKFNITTVDNGEFSMVYSTRTVGDYLVAASLISDDYASSDGQLSFEIKKLDTVLESSVKTNSDNSSLLITYRLLDERGAPVSNATINIVSGDNNTALVTDENGQCTYEYPKSDASLVVYAYYDGDTNHISSENHVYIEDNRIETSLEIYYGKLDYNNTTGKYIKPITIFLRDSYDNVLVNQNITLIINGDIIQAVTDNNGEFQYNFTTDALGSYPLEAYYSGNNVYLQSGFNRSMKVIKYDIYEWDIDVYHECSKIIIDVDSMYIEDWGRVTPDYLTFIVNGEENTVYSDEYGDYYLTYPVNETGKYKIIIVFDGNELVNPANKTRIIEIVDQYIDDWDIDVYQYGRNVKLYVDYIYLNDWSYFTPENITVTINGEENIVNYNGYYYLTYPVNETGNYTVNIAFLGNYYVAPANTTCTVEINKIRANITLNSIASVNLTDEIEIRGFISDDYLNGETIFIRINNEVYNTTIVYDDEFSLRYRTKTVGINNVTVYMQGELYDVANVSTTFEVLLTQNSTVLTVDPIVETQINSKIMITGKLTDSNSTAISDATIIMTVDGNQFTNKTDVNGKYSFTYVPATAGELNIYLAYEGNDSYASSHTDTSVTVNKKHSNITIDETGAHAYGETVTITGKLTDNGNAISNATVSMKVNGNIVTGVTNIAGEYSISYVASKVGSNDILISFMGDDTYEACKTDTTITINKQNTRLTINPITQTYYDDTVLITGTLTDATGKTLADISLTIRLNNEDIPVTTNSNGIFTLNTTATKIGTNTVTVTFNGNANYTQTNASTTFTVVSKDTVITIDEIGQKVYSEAFTITGKVTDVDGITVGNVNVTVKVNGASVTNVTDSAGRFTVNAVANNVGVNNVTVSFDGTVKYSPSGNSTTFNVLPLSTVLSVDNIENVNYSDNVRISGRLVTNTSAPVAGASVDVIVNGVKTTAVTGVDGTFALTIVAGTVGVNNVTVSFADSGIYAGSNDTTTFTVMSKDSVLTVDAIGTVVYSDAFAVTGKVAGADGTVIGNVMITVKVNGVAVTNITDSAGRFTVNAVANAAGTNNVTVTFDGNGYYSASANSTTFTVLPTSTVLSVDDIASVGYSDNVTVSGILVTNTSAAVAGARVDVVVNGVKTTAVTGGDGVFTVTKVTDTMGTNNVSVTFTGNGSYTGSTSSTTFTVVPMDTRITFNPIGKVETNTNVTIKITLTKANGQALSNSNVELTVNSVTSKVVTDKNGVYTLVYNATKSGLTTVNAIYNGNDKYNSCSTTTTFNVTGKENVIVTVDPIGDVETNSNITISGTFKRACGNVLANSNVRLNINGVTYYAKTNGNGVYTFTYNVIKSGVNTLVAGYGGSGNYNPYNTTVTFKATGKENVIVTVDPIADVETNSNITITGTFKRACGNVLGNSNVRLKINGVTYYAKTNSKGVYTFTYNVTKSGVNTLVAGYGGSGNYNPYNTTVTFKATGKENVIVTVDPIGDVETNSIITISGTFKRACGNVLANSNVRLKINGVTYYAKTNSKGVYSYTYNVTKTGVNTLVAGYGGSGNYNPYNTTVKFNAIGKENVIVTVDPISTVETNTNITITGTFKRASGNVLANSNVRLNINGVTYYAKTNSKGVYTFTYNVTKSGVNTLVAGYGGNGNYNPYSTTVKFNATGKENVIVTVDPIGEVKKNSNVTISGTFKRACGNVLANSKVKLTVNGVTTYVKTDSKGVYTYTYNATKSGVNTVVAGYGGSGNYNAYTTTTKFIVV